MNSNSGGYDISSLTRHRSGHHLPAGNPSLGHHLSHASAFGPHSGQHTPQQTHHGQHHPLLNPNLLIGNHGVMPPSPGVMHPSHHHVPQSLTGHHSSHLPSATANAGHHLPSQYSHALLHQQIPHPTASPALHHQSSPSLLHHSTQGNHFGSQGVHQPTAVVATPVVQHPPPAPSPSLAVPVVPEATNALASSVNLGAIQSLVDVLVDLPLPTEAPELAFKKDKLLEDDQHQAGLTMDHHNLLSQLLSPCLQSSKMQVSQMNTSFIDRLEVPSSNRSQSAIHDKNAYLLSLLNHGNVFGPNAILPPAAVAVPPSGILSRQQQQQYWNPWTEQQNQSQSEVTAPLSTSVPAVNTSPYTSSPHGSSYSRSTQNQGTVYNNNHHNDSNSNSSSFTDPSTPTPLMTPSSVENNNVAVGHNNRYQQQPQQGSHLQSQVVQQQEPPFAEYQSQEDNMTSVQPVIKANNNHPSMEPVTMLDKNEPAMDRALEDYCAKVNGPSSSTTPGLADRVKSQKRQRSESSYSKSSHENKKDKKSNDIYKEVSLNNKSSSSSASSSPIKKQVKISPVKSSQSSNKSYTNSYITPGYLSSSTPQLRCLSQQLPTSEKFEAMLEELFDLGTNSTTAKKKSESSEDDSEEDNDHALGKKSKNSKMNGEVLPSGLFDITLSGETLSHFVAVTAKLKRSNKMSDASTSKISYLLSALTQQLTVQAASLKRRRSTDEPTASDDDEEDNNITTSAQLLHKFESCCDCSLIALNILSSKGMPSKVYLEECIEQVINFLNNTIQQFTTIGSAGVSSPSKTKSRSPKKVNNYVAPTTTANKKVLSKMYTKWSELIGLLVELLSLRSGSLTDVLVLSTTRLALAAFFLENLSSNSSVASLSSSSNSNEVQLNALKLTTAIFAQYPAHRPGILEELLSSIARLPTSKRGRVVYNVDGEEGSACISMFSALLQELIQSLFTKSTRKEQEEIEDPKDRKMKKVASTLKQEYEDALKVAYHFMNIFLRRCCGISVGGQPVSSSDGDLRVLFEGLVSDLMITLHKPNWPAAQLLTQVIVRMLITNITSTAKTKGAGGAGPANAQLNLKLASLDHLGTICSRFAKELSDVEIVKNEVKSSLNTILTGDVVIKRKTTNGEDSDATDVESEAEPEVKRKKRLTRRPKGFLDFLQSDEKLIKEIWKHLIRFCDEEDLEENKNLLVSIWLKEMARDVDQQQSSEDGLDSNGIANLSNHEQLEAKVKSFMTLYLTASNRNLEEDEYHIIDSKTAGLIIRYLDISQSTTVKLFDSALMNIIKTLNMTSNTTMRSKAMKCLSIILNNARKENATALLARTDLQAAMKNALCDPSTSVREATIDLIGKFILSGQSEDLIDRYYDIIADRVLDTGVSVRKRVIKILRDICVAYPSHPKVPEVCSKIIKRVNDDGEGIRKLVTETFTSMWFKEEQDKDAVKLKVKCLNHVVATVISDKIGTEWLQQLLSNLFAAQNDVNKKKTITELEEEEDKPARSQEQLQQVTNASSQIIDVIVSDILCGESNEGQQENQRKSNILSAVTTLWLFSKVSPQLLLNHVSTLHPFISTKCVTVLDVMIFIKVVQILELVLPKAADLSDSQLSRIEEDLAKHILQSSGQVLPYCVSCLATVITKHSNNRVFAQDLFDRFFTTVRNMAWNQTTPDDGRSKPILIRSLFTCGLFGKHFAFLKQKNELFQAYIKFIEENAAQDGQSNAKDTELLSKALSGLGFMCERNPEFTTRQETRNIYRSMLSSFGKSVAYEELVQTQVLKNLTNYLSDEFNQECAARVNWSKENLKSMCSDDGDSNSLQSTIVQCYLPDVTKCTLSSILNVRRAAVNLVHIIHNGGYVHPLQLVPYLIAMSSDDDVSIRLRADHVLNEIERKYHGYVSMKSKIGVHLCYQLHSHTGRRGYRIENVHLAAPPVISANSPPVTASTDDKLITGRLATLYSVVASNRQSRRAFVTSLLKYFDCVDGSVSAGFNDVMTGTSVGSESMESDPGPVQQFVCDNIVWLPYSLWDEPLYLLTQIEVNTSILASNLQSQFKDALHLSEEDEDALDNKVVELKIQHNENEGENEGNGEGDDAVMMPEVVPVSGESLSSGLKSQIYKPLPPRQAITELIRVLRAYYMLIWSKHLIRELYGVTDLKVQDYSPNENQKVWDKTVHRKTFDVRQVDRLMAYPAVTLDLNNDENLVREQLLQEYQRFKDVQVTGDQMSRFVASILKEPFGRGPVKDFCQTREAPMTAPRVVPSMSREAQDELIERMRSSECSISLAPLQMNNSIPQTQSNTGLKMTINLSAAQSKAKKKKTQKKKKKKHRKREDSDSNEESDYSDSEDSGDDPSYD